MKVHDSVGFKNSLDKALIEGNGAPLAKSITQYKVFLNPSKKRLSNPTSSFHLFEMDRHYYIDAPKIGIAQAL